MKLKLLFLIAALPSLALADRLGSLRSSADVLLTTQAVASSGGVSVYPATSTIITPSGINTSTISVSGLANFNGGAQYTLTSHPLYINNSNYMGSYETGIDFQFNYSPNGSIKNLNYSATDGSNNLMYKSPFIISPQNVDTLFVSPGFVSVGPLTGSTAVMRSTFSVLGNMSVGSTPVEPPLNGLYVQGSINNAALGTSLGVCTDGSKNLTTSGCSFGSSGGGIVSPGTFTWVNTGYGISVSTVSVSTIAITGQLQDGAGNSIFKNNDGTKSLLVGSQTGPITANYNTLVGNSAGNSLSAGTRNTLIGYNAGATTDFSYDSIIGANVGTARNGISNYNYAVMIGGDSTNSYANTGVTGIGSGVFANGVSNYATGVGYAALAKNAGAYTTGVGYQSLNQEDAANVTNTPQQNVGIGYRSGYTLKSGYYNTFLGSTADVGTALGLNYTTAIGYGAVATSSHTMQLGGHDSSSEMVLTDSATINSLQVSSNTILTGTTFYAWASPVFTIAPTLTGLTASQCVQTDANGKLVSSGGVCGGSGGGSSALAVSIGVSRSSPTSDLMFNSNQFTGSISGSSITVTLNSSSVTLMGNTFNGVSQLVQSDANNSVKFSSNVVMAGTTYYAQGTVVSSLPRYFTGTVAMGGPSSAITIASNTVLAGTTFYSQGTTIFGGSVGASNLSGSNTGDQTISLTGDVTGSGTGSFAATLSNGIPNAHSWSGAQTYTSSLTISTPGVVSVKISSNVILSGTTFYSQGTTILSGAISASNLSGSNTGDQTITLSGDATGTGTTAITITNAARQANITTLSASSITVSGNVEVDGWTTQKGSMSVTGSGLGVTYGVTAGTGTFYTTTPTNALVVMSTNNVTAFAVSNSTVTAGDYMLSIASSTATGSAQIFTVDTYGGAGLFAYTKAQFAAMTPGKTNVLLGCSDCSALMVCISTGTTVGAWSSPVAKTTACN